MSELLPEAEARDTELVPTRGHSSAGRAPALQAGGRRFESDCLHQEDLKNGAPAKRSFVEALETDKNGLCFCRRGGVTERTTFR